MPMYVQNKVNSIISPFPFLQVLMLLHFQWSGPQGFADIFTPIQLYFKMMKKLLSSQQEYGFQHFCRFSLFSEVPISVSVCLLCECAFHSIPNTETSDLHLATILKLHRWARFLTRLVIFRFIMCSFLSVKTPACPFVVQSPLYALCTLFLLLKIFVLIKHCTQYQPQIAS